MISLSKYRRVDLSNFLQIAQQADNAGHPLPCVIIDRVRAVHDLKLNQPIASGKKLRNVEIHKGPGICKHHVVKLQQRPCGKGYFCPECHDDIYGIKIK